MMGQQINKRTHKYDMICNKMGLLEHMTYGMYMGYIIIYNNNTCCFKPNTKAHNIKPNAFKYMVP